ncbi:MAG: hypothetical protein QOF55_772 [Thermoleophilaceae bacterium]|jgi:hypothetical protein|nr:hypothetical protein [Thermoleophilaceae bacterium]
MTVMVILRVKNPGVETSRLLARLEQELGVGAQPQTAGYVPLSLDQIDEDAARARVVEVLEGADADWREHIELRT